MNRSNPRLIFLLGAGASAQVDIPVAIKLTHEIANLTSTDPEDHLANAVLWFVLGALKMQRGSNASNPLANDIDVEEMFSAMVALRDRNDNQLAPFVSSWHEVIKQLTTRSALERDLLPDAILKTNFSSEDLPRTAAELLSRKQAAAYLGVSDITLAIWCNTRRYNLQVYKIGRLAKCKKSDLDAFIASGRQA